MSISMNVHPVDFKTEWEVGTSGHEWFTISYDGYSSYMAIHTSDTVSKQDINESFAAMLRKQEYAVTAVEKRGDNEETKPE